MYLLDFDDIGDLRLSEFFHDQIPPYAILSHTWGPDADEVTYKDVRKGRGKDKEGFKKIDFCMRQAAKDGLAYCWIDACCIDKSNNTELSEAINSMFRWYRNAATCYVYLADVPDRLFKESRWFTRGWTLQELISPTRIEFYSATGIHLGSRESLLEDLHEITGVPKQVLQGDQTLSQFSMEERMCWIEKRRTKREEDLAYSLLGILGVSMPLIYGEGRQNAMFRLRAQFRAVHAQQDRQPLPAQYTDWENFSLPLVIRNVHRPLAFVGRQAELRELRNTLRSSTNLEPVVLHGLSGIGKTTLAYEFATKHYSDFSVVFWINGWNENLFRQDLLTAARRVPHLEPVFAKGSILNIRSESAHECLNAMTKWLRQRGNNRWLVIIDNVQEKAPYDWSSYIPMAQGRVLLISQSTLSQPSQHFLLNEMEGKDDSLEILLRYSHRPGIATEPQIDDLIKCLDGFPLALSLAGTFLKQAAASPAEYLEQYNSSWLELQSMSPTLPEHEGRKLHTTWEQCYDEAQRQDINAGKLLQVLACFGDSEVDFDLLSAGVDDNAPQWYQSIMQNKFTLGRCVHVLCEHDLVRRSDVSGAYRVHPCVRAWLRAVCIEDYHPFLVLRSIANSLPPSFPNEPIQWSVVQRILPHAEQWITWLQSQTWPSEAAEHMTKLGTLCIHFSLFHDAEILLKKALQIRESFPSVHLSGLVEIMVSLGHTYIGLSRYEEAKEKIQNALDIYRSDTQPSLACNIRARTAYMDLLLWQEQPGDAKEQCLQLLKESEDSFGSRHFLTLNIVRILADIYDACEDSDEAKAQSERALKGFELLLGEDHPQVLNIARHLGYILCSQSQVAEAEKLIRRAVNGHMNAFGPRHVMTLGSQQALATVYQLAEKHVEAQQLLEYVITRASEVLGTHSSEALHAKLALGRSLRRLQNMQQAADVYKECVITSTKLLGPDYTLTLTAVYNLARAQYSLGDIKGAETKAREAVNGFKSRGINGRVRWLTATLLLARILEEQYRHEELSELSQAWDTEFKTWPAAFLKSQAAQFADARYYAGTALNGQNRPAEAETMFNEAYINYAHTEGEESVNTLEVFESLAFVKAEQRKYEDARPLYEQLIAHWTKMLSSRPDKARPSIARINYNLGLTLEGLNEYAKAEVKIREALEEFTALHGSEHKLTLNALFHLALIYQKLGDHDKEEACQLQLAAGRTTALGANNAQTLAAKLQLAGMYNRRGKPEAAKGLVLEILSGQDDSSEAMDPDLRMDLMEVLGWAHESLREWAEVERVQLTVLFPREKKYGSEDYRTIRTMMALGNCYKQQKKYGVAEEMLNRAIRYRQKALGPENPIPLIMNLSLAMLYEAEGKSGDSSKVDQARALLEHVYQSLERNLGIANETTLHSATVLAKFCQRRRETQRARDVWRHIADGYKELYGSSHEKHREAAENLTASQALLDEVQPETAPSPKHSRLWKKRK